MPLLQKPTSYNQYLKKVASLESSLTSLLTKYTSWQLNVCWWLNWSNSITIIVKDVWIGHRLVVLLLTAVIGMPVWVGTGYSVHCVIDPRSQTSHQVQQFDIHCIDLSHSSCLPITLTLNDVRYTSQVMHCCLFKQIMKILIHPVEAILQ